MFDNDREYTERLKDYIKKENQNELKNSLSGTGWNIKKDQDILELIVSKKYTDFNFNEKEVRKLVNYKKRAKFIFNKNLSTCTKIYKGKLSKKIKEKVFDLKKNYYICFFIRDFSQVPSGTSYYPRMIKKTYPHKYNYSVELILPYRTLKLYSEYKYFKDQSSSERFKGFIEKELIEILSNFLNVKVIKKKFIVGIYIWDSFP